MRRLAIPVGVLLILLGVGALAVQSAFAASPFGGPWGGGPPWTHGGEGPWKDLPPELAGLRDLPAGERFAHFKGVRVNLTDKENRPLAIDVVPGKVTAADAGSVTLAANDGSTRTFTLDAKTKVRKAPAANDQAVVVTINGAANAAAVMVVGPDGFGGPGFGPHRGGPPWGGR
jgi:hypothetical protein